MTVAYIEPRTEVGRRRADDPGVVADPDLAANRARVLAYLDPDTGARQVTAVDLHRDVDSSTSVARWDALLAHLALAAPGPDPRTFLDPVGGDPLAYALGPRGWAHCRRIALPPWPHMARAKARLAASLEPQRWETSERTRARYAPVLRFAVAASPDPVTIIQLADALGSSTQDPVRVTVELMAAGSRYLDDGHVDEPLFTGWPPGPVKGSTPWTLTPAGAAAAARLDEATR